MRHVYEMTVQGPSKLEQVANWRSGGLGMWPGRHGATRGELCQASNHFSGIKLRSQFPAVDVMWATFSLRCGT